MLGVGPSNHVDVEVGHRVFQGEHRMVCVVLAAQQPFFLTHHIHEQHAATWTHAVRVFKHFELTGKFHHRDGA